MSSTAKAEPGWIRVLVLSATLAAVIWYGQHQLVLSMQFLYRIAVLISPGLASLLK